MEAVVKRWRPVLLAIAAVRTVLAIVAIPLAPLLYDDHFLLVVLLRPTKEVLLIAGFLASEGDVFLPAVVAAAVPLLLFGVWVLYGLGLAYRDEISEAKLPGIAGRLLPAERIQQMQETLGERGAPLVLIGRLAAFPSSVVAAAAGASGMPFKRFALADGVGAALSIVEVVGAGLLLQEAHDSAGPWLTGVGVVALVAVLVLAGRMLKHSGDHAPSHLHRTPARGHV